MSNRSNRAPSNYLIGLEGLREYAMCKVKG
jgi:hypothetical protein